MKLGDKVDVKLENGYTSTGTIVRRFKNGRYGVREVTKHGSRYYVRSAKNVHPVK